MSGVAFDSTQVDASLAQVRELLGNLSPILQSTGESLLTAVMRRFQEGGPGWQALSDTTLARNPRRVGGIPLNDTGRLRSSLRRDTTEDTASVGPGTDVIYAAIHQFGGTVHPFGRKRDERGRFLTGAGGGGITIPARPYLRVTDEEVQDIVADIRDWLARAFAG